MPYDQGLATRIEEIMTDLDVTFVPKKMFGGLAFLVRGYMTVGVGQDELMVRFDKDKYQEYLKLPGAREMDFTGRPMKGFVFVDPAALSEDQDLKTWIQKSLDYVTTLPDKKIQT